MPSRLFMSSGDMVADRRFDYARDLQLSGDLVAAEDLFVQATDLAPGFATAWFTLGEVREQLGDRNGAIAAFRTAEITDPGDRNGAGLRLMRLGATLAAMRPGYVKALFDQYAPRFDAALLDHLGYRGPALLAAAVVLARAAVGRPATFARAIDLGCGTGLAARAFAPMVEELIGFDLSPRMIERARLSGLYAELEVAEIVEGLAARQQASADLVIAADVMVYVHDMTLLLREVARVLVAGGLFAFTVESHAGDGIVLGEGLRYVYTRACVQALIAAAGLKLASLEPASSRTESGVQVPGLVVVAAKAD
jgi:predicted TPR repeat methyltransferase